MIERAAAAVMAVSALAPAMAQLELRGLEPTPQGKIAAVSAEGVTIGDAPAGSIISSIIGWDRVRAVHGPRAADAEPFAALAEQAWRARTRLERGDAPAAEPLFEELFSTTRGTSGPTAAVAAEGLMRCRLRRGAHVAAVEPWLAYLRATQPDGRMPIAQTAPRWLHADWARDAGLPAVFDPATGLAPALPPIWLEMPALQTLAADERPAWETGRIGALAELYRQAARFEMGQEAALPPMERGDAGVALVQEIVRSRAGDPAARRAAQAALRTRATEPTVPAWTEAWCRAALGRSMLLDPDPDQQRLGVIELLHVPARFRTLHPYLAGTALAQAAAALQGLGDDAGAATLRRELEADYPGHPAIEWLAARIKPTRPAAAAKATPEKTQDEEKK